MQKTLKRFHPGFIYQAKGAGTGVEELAGALAPGFVGAFVDLPWAMLEPSRGAYDFALIRRYLDWGEEHDRRLLFMLADRDFSRSAATSRIVPKWVASTPFNKKRDDQGCVARIWTKEVNDARIALIRAIMGEFANHPQFEALSLQETALGRINSASDKDYTNAGYTGEIRRLIREVAPVLGAVQLWQSINWLTKQDTYLEAIAQTLYETGAGGFTLPDNVPWEPDKLMYGVVKRWAGRLPIAFGGDTSQLDKPGGDHYQTFDDLVQMTVDFALSHFAHYIMLKETFHSQVASGAVLSQAYGAAVKRLVAANPFFPTVPTVLRREEDGEEPGPTIDVELLRALLSEGEGWLARVKAVVGN